MIAPRAATAGLIALSLAGCSPRLIRGTEIPDNADTRAIVGTLDRYRQAWERRDAAAILALVSAGYFDDAGTADPSDDLDYAGLQKAVPDTLVRLTSARLDLKVTRIAVDGDRAEAYVRFDARYRVATRAGEVAKVQADVNRVLLVKEQGTWKIRSGL